MLSEFRRNKNKKKLKYGISSDKNILK